MKKRTIYSMIGIVTISVIGFGFMTKTQSPQEHIEGAIVVGNVHKTVNVDAVMYPDVYRDITTEIPALIEWVGVEMGDYVQVGQELLRLDRDIINAQIYNAQLAVERAELAENQGRRKSSGLDSREVLSLKKATAQARQVRNELYAQAKKTAVTATIEGVVTMQNARVGEVSTGLMMRIIDINSLQAEVLIPEVDIAKIRVGASVEVIFDAYPESPVRGNVQQIEVGSINIQNNTYYKAILSMENTGDVILMDGMNASVDIEFARQESVLSISRDFAFRDENGYFVYIVDLSQKKGNIFVKEYFQEGLVGDEYIEVLGGLTKGLQVVQPQVSTE